MASDETTPMMRQYLEIKKAHQDSILFFRMGDFYEMFLEDAKQAAPILEIALTTRDKNSLNPIPMCGVPHHSAGSYINRLVAKGMRVAICDQVEDPKMAKGIVKRQVTRIVTPGTNLGVDGYGDGVSNYIGSFATTEDGYGFIWGDIATGDCFAFSSQDSDRAIDEIRKAGVRELIVSQLDANLPNIERLLQGRQVIIRGEDSSLFSENRQSIEDLLDISSIDKLSLSSSRPLMSALSGLAVYLQSTQMKTLAHLNLPKLREENDYLITDSVARRDLELTESISSAADDHCLLSTINQTVTKTGERNLCRWLENPLMDERKINARLDFVGALIADTDLLGDLRESLKKTKDLDRILGRMVMGTANVKDLLGLKESLVQVSPLESMLVNLQLPLAKSIVQKLVPQDDLIRLLAKSILDGQETGDVESRIAPGFSDELDRLRKIQQQSKNWLVSFEASERDRSAIGNLKVKYNKVFGYFIEVSKSNLSKVPDDYERKQTLVNAERFTVKALSAMAVEILSANEKIERVEQELWQQIVADLLAKRNSLKIISQAFADVDALQSLAQTAANNDYCRPHILASENEISIVGGRHPVVEQCMQRDPFVPNDISLNNIDKQILLITGPNMAGKSTILRQVAQIVILAQMGSFVPAEQARVGLVDRIFTRIGASDDIAGGRSTFMVEMAEAANMMRFATARSLLILDEIGRGTSTYDGLSIAWSLIIHIHQNIRARTIFATHYQELTQLSKTYSRCHNLQVAVKEEGDEVVFLHQLVAGGASKSHGIYVARLAGLPAQVVDAATKILRDLEKPATLGPAAELDDVRSDAGDDTNDFNWLADAVRSIDTDNLTPMEALKRIVELQLTLRSES